MFHNGDSNTITSPKRGGREEKEWPSCRLPPPLACPRPRSVPPKSIVYEGSVAIATRRSPTATAAACRNGSDAHVASALAGAFSGGKGRVDAHLEAAAFATEAATWWQWRRRLGAAQPPISAAAAADSSSARPRTGGRVWNGVCLVKGFGGTAWIASHSRAARRRVIELPLPDFGRVVYAATAAAPHRDA